MHASSRLVVVISSIIAAVAAGCGVRTPLEIGMDGSVGPLPDGARPDSGRRDGGRCVTSEDCDDGRFCNGFEGCVGGTCVPGERPFCDDGVACTEDRCQEDTDSCASVPNDALCGPGAFCDPFTGCVGRTCVSDVECDDGFVCNGTEVCGPDGRCIGGLMAPDCDDGLDCTIDVCDEPGVCTTLPDDTRCRAGAHCDLMLGCVGGGCTSSFECDDGSVCNGTEVCAGGSCAPGPRPSCDDGIACTRDECLDTVGGCTSTPDSTLCPTGFLCEPGAGSPDGCVFRTCRSDAECTDGLFCNGQERCDRARGVCVPGTVPSCNDFQDCTVDRCVEAFGGCVSEPRAARETCGNRIDDDCDGLIDCRDPDCAGVPGCPSCVPEADFEFACGDMIDQDCDGLFDCGDPDCTGSPECCRPVSMVELDCFDGRDDDCDFAPDCSDPDCVRACAPPEDCGNRFDDDGDGLTDCVDPDCRFDFRCRDGGVPVDGGPPIDGGPVRGEIGIAACTNGRDDDLDGRVDCRDPDCSPFGSMGECCNGRDDDGDGNTDIFTCRCYDDSTCVGVGDLDQVCWESSFSVCAPRCNFYGGDAFCRMYLPDLPRCNAMTGECVR